MALRVLLVSLVASMGFELPSGKDVQSWSENGSQWIKARVAELSSSQGDTERAIVGRPDTERPAETTPSVSTEVASLRDDLTFDAVVDGIAANFVTDLATIEVAKPVEQAVAKVEPAPEVTQPGCFDPEAIVPGTDVIADETTRTTPIIAEVIPETAPAPATVAKVEPSPVDRLASAVQLTKQAVNAWASLIQPTTERAAEPDQDDTF